MSANEFELITIGQSDDITTKESYIDASSIPVASSVVLPHLVDEACPWVGRTVGGIVLFLLDRLECLLVPLPLRVNDLTPSANFKSLSYVFNQVCDVYPNGHCIQIPSSKYKRSKADAKIILFSRNLLLAQSPSYSPLEFVSGAKVRLGWVMLNGAAVALAVLRHNGRWIERFGGINKTLRVLRSKWTAFLLMKICRWKDVR